MIGLLVLCAAALLAYRTWSKQSAKRKRPLSNLPYPPGPPGYPLIGNLLDFPANNKPQIFHRWSQRYDSDIIHLNICGNSVLILNSAEAVNDLLEKRSSIYSGRPTKNTTMLNELMGFAWNIASLDYGPFWKSCRRLMHQELAPEATERYQPHQTKATHELLRRLSDSPDQLLDHLRHMTGETIMSLAYGIDVLPVNDPYIQAAGVATYGVAIAGDAGTFLVDYVSALKYIPSWVPGAGFQNIAQYVHEHASKLLILPYEATKLAIEKGNGKPCFVSHCLAELESDTSGDATVEEEVIRVTAGTMYLAAADTTVSTITSIILGLLSNLHVLRMAQEEIDHVVGSDRLPNFSDQASLPWITAIVQEGIRWAPVTPLAVVHKLSVDDEYKGYFLPAESVVFGNAWAILHDEKAYPEPHKFKPERFMKNGAVDPNVKDPALAAFGFGRRICPGRFTAQSSVWIAIASILATFDIAKAADEKGDVVEPTYEWTSGLFSYPVPFSCSITRRTTDTPWLQDF